MAPALNTQIDALYQLPLEQFTIARNVLAKTLSGNARKQVGALPKPSLPVWAVNQLYWNSRPAYSALIDAAEKLRAAHRAVVSGRQADVRKPEAVHRAALERAVAQTGRSLESKSDRPSAAAVDAVRRILSALPTDVPAGRLTREPEPAGFGLLAGITPKAIKAVHAPTPSTPHAKVQPARSNGKQLARARRELQEARSAMAAAAANAKRIAISLKRIVDAEAKHRATLDKLVASRDALEAEHAQSEADARRLASRVTMAEQAVQNLRVDRGPDA